MGEPPPPPPPFCPDTPGMLGSRGTLEPLAAAAAWRPLERAELILSVESVVVSVPALDDAPLLLSRLCG